MAIYIMSVFGVQLAGVIPETRSVCDLELCVGDVHPAYHWDTVQRWKEKQHGIDPEFQWDNFRYTRKTNMTNGKTTMNEDVSCTKNGDVPMSC